jgi:hypothetical protein
MGYQGDALRLHGIRALTLPLVNRDMMPADVRREPVIPNHSRRCLAFRVSRVIDHCVQRGRDFLDSFLQGDVFRRAGYFKKDIHIFSFWGFGA